MRSASLTTLILLLLLTTPALAQRDVPRDRPPADRQFDFVPQNDRERALFEMIKRLRAEITSLKKQLQAREGDRVRLLDQGGSRGERLAPRDGDRPRVSAESGGAYRARTNPILQKATRIFAAYDTNNDEHVSFEEWLAMREGEISEERRDRERTHFAEPAGSDNKITLEEFYRWMERRSRGGSREGRSDGPREGDSRQPVQRDRE